MASIFSVISEKESEVDTEQESDFVEDFSEIQQGRFHWLNPEEIHQHAQRGEDVQSQLRSGPHPLDRNGVEQPPHKEEDHDVHSVGFLIVEEGSVLCFEFWVLEIVILLV